jgi:F-type H+-transporting ATPase subunit b
MKRFNSIVLVLLCGAAWWFGAGNEVLAAGTDGGWRSTYDLILRWINFGILAFILLRVGKTPFKNFLSGQKEKLANELKRKEEEKEAATNEVKEIEDALKDAEIRFAAIKDRIVEQGEKQKQRIIEGAKMQSRQIIEDAKRRVDGQILQAKQRIKSELVESAVELAMKRLPKEITEEDNQRLLEQFLSGTASSK